MVLETAGIAVHGRTHRARVGGRTVELTEREFALLESFMRNPGQILSKEQLFEQVWGPGYEPGSGLVQVYVGYLRKKLGPDSIETVRGMGYRLTV